MERLTHIDHLGWYANGHGGERIRGSHINRLAAYEDLMERWKLRSIEEADRIFQRVNALGGTDLMAQYRAIGSIGHLRDLIKAEKEGRMVVLPCKVGDAAYWLHNGIITECRVHRIQMNRTGLFICLKSKVSHGAFRVDTCLGKTVFLTREEAEAALALKGGEG